jgi:hypothetical protein
MIMLNKLATNYRYYTFKLWLFTLLLSQGIYIFMQAYTIPRISSEAGGLQIFDIQLFGYTHEYAYQFLSLLSLEGYTLYREVQLPLDTLFPLMNSLTAVLSYLLIIRLYKKVLHPSEIQLRSSFSTAIFMLPIVAMLSDYLENIMIWIMLSNKIEVAESIISFAKIFTITKNLSTSLFYIIIIAIIGKIGVSWFRNRKKKEPMHDELRG